MESLLRLPSNGKSIFGVLHEPAGARLPLGVVFLNAGPQNRVGPQRIYLKAARAFCDAGMTCLRVDLPGVGESEGAFFDGTPDSYDAADVRGTVDLLSARGIRSVALLGLCAGARAAVRAACSDERVEAVVCWSVPIVSGASEFDGFSPAATRAVLRHWTRRVLQPGRWVHYLTSRERWRQASSKVAALLSTLGRSPQREALAFVQQLRALRAERRAVLFAFGERDIGTFAEFTQYFASESKEGDAAFRVLVVKDGDHTFTSIAARDRVISETLAWLADRHAHATTWSRSSMPALTASAASTS